METENQYYVVSYLWQTPKCPRLNSGTALIETTKGIVGVYERCIGQPESWCLTHVCEITKSEYDQAKRDGHIG